MGLRSVVRRLQRRVQARQRPLLQQTRFDEFAREFNTGRPHEALAMKTPAQLYPPSPRPYIGLPEVSYPLHDRAVVVTACGRRASTSLTCWPISASASRRSMMASGSQLPALRSRLHRPGAEDPATPGQPVRPGVVTYVLGTNRHPCLRSVQSLGGGDGGIRTLDAAFWPHAPLAGECLRPLGHVSLERAIVPARAMPRPRFAFFLPRFSSTALDQRLATFA